MHMAGVPDQRRKKTSVDADIGPSIYDAHASSNNRPQQGSFAPITKRFPNQIHWIIDRIGMVIELIRDTKQLKVHWFLAAKLSGVGWFAMPLS